MGVELHEVQGNVLAGYGPDFPRASFRFCRIDDADAARAWLTTLLPAVTTAAPWPDTEKPSRTLNVALSSTGLEALGMPPAALAALPAEFRAGMAARAGHLCDRDEDAPDRWQEGLDDRVAQLVVTVHVRSADPAVLAAAVGETAPPPGVTVLHDQHTAMLTGGREHFGFSDGLAQPAIDDDVAGPYHGTGTPGRRRRRVGRWAKLQPGEFITGYPDEDADTPGGPPPLDRNATYMVIRKLDQHVGAWERQVHRWAGGDPALAEALAAQVVGRWRNGTPVERSPHAPDPRLDDPAPPATPAARAERFALLNDFGYAGGRADPRCPAGAHIRRANPRDAFGDGRLARRHRIVRRGMPYGPEVADADRLTERDEVERGLFFVCYQASITRQFELIQREWLRDGDAFGLGRQNDPLLSPGDPDGRLIAHHRGDPRLLTPYERSVTLRGGGYFVVPSRSALAALATPPH
ncbi:Dyp-type peroxidase [Paraconexibacter antarcticus]|uniref:Dyp-type peroxidase n=1 Tax=Paraconexibacter antarcticus TaxID=2949664 RepID=A0ABY5DV53_9ACTN|nr:Dyp-type peroxidase [Paraconexibacter antarcticus]UTI64942.1 Dyp-type peroxidase [Paraconexibacter antarcticus]